MKLISLMLLVLPAVAGNAWAHGGGLNKEGCHNDRKNGGYHCHRASSLAQVEQRYQPANQLAASNYAAPARSPGGRAFANCSEARAAGAAPVRRGGPGYGLHLDRDNDGIGCEPYKGRETDDPRRYSDPYFGLIGLIDYTIPSVGRASSAYDPTPLVCRT